MYRLVLFQFKYEFAKRTETSTREIDNRLKYDSLLFVNKINAY